MIAHRALESSLDLRVFWNVHHLTLLHNGPQPVKALSNLFRPAVLYSTLSLLRLLLLRLMCDLSGGRECWQTPPRHAYTHTHIYIYIHMCTRIYIYIYTYLYAHIVV